MVRAILEGRKTQTRRVIKLSEAMNCPYGLNGDRLWVRETWKPDPSFGYPQRTKPSELDHQTNILYRASLPEEHPKATCQKWRPSIFMPRWASRITLEIKSVRSELVQEISEADAIAEGINVISHGREGKYYHPTNTVQEGGNYVHAADAYCHLWNRINSRRGFGWDINPWVWVIEFRRTTS
jgi:hypothetical protein